MTQKEINNLIVGGIVTLAMGVNGYFVKRLVDKVDRIDNIESDIHMIKWRLGLVQEAKEKDSNEVHFKKGEGS